MKQETYTYTLPAHWASYLINGDASGLSDEERGDADSFLQLHTLPFPVNCGEQYFSRANDWNHLGGDVCAFTFLLNVGSDGGSK